MLKRRVFGDKLGLDRTQFFLVIFGGLAFLAFIVSYFQICPTDEFVSMAFWCEDKQTSNIFEEPEDEKKIDLSSQVVFIVDVPYNTDINDVVYFQRPNTAAVKMKRINTTSLRAAITLPPFTTAFYAYGRNEPGYDNVELYLENVDQINWYKQRSVIYEPPRQKIQHDYIRKWKNSTSSVN